MREKQQALQGSLQHHAGQSELSRVQLTSLRRENQRAIQELEHLRMVRRPLRSDWRPF
jgi:hypothetical protein